MYTDTHAHLYYDDLIDQLDFVIKRAETASVKRIICVGTDLSSSRTSISIAERYDCVFATAGVHPHDAKDAPADYLTQVKELLSHEKVVAVGEMGLDFFRNLSFPDRQREVFRSQLELANELGVPAVIHNRDADEDLLKIIDEVSPKKAVLHCFSSDVPTAERALNAGCLLSFTGNVTFGKNSTEAVLKVTPVDRIMLETDCPFMTPVPNRGKVNEPSNIPYISKRIAEIKNMEPMEIARITSETAQVFFGLPA
ncbi:MAG: TatD family hydrolase [Candidatus Neomarinimicrobiota bacterium]|nr:TatD family hydrolase [Candidatus Neomarinimicrobiota bacterium]